MLTQVLWWSCIACVSLLLIQGVKGRFFSKYLVFYLYLCHVLLTELLRFYLYTNHRNAYRTFYWYTEFVSLAAGCFVLWEVYGQTFAAYPGTLRMARWLLLSIFILVLAKGLINSLSGPVWGPAETVLDLERNFRTVQAVMLAVIVGVLKYYMIPIGRNLRGIVLGYGVFVGTLVINNTLWSQFGDRFQLWLQYSESAAYLVTLLIWCAALWSYHPNPAPAREIEIESDYEWLSARTAQAVSRARAQVLRGVRG